MQARLSRMFRVFEYAYFTDLLIMGMLALLLASGSFPFRPIGAAIGAVAGLLVFRYTLVFLDGGRLAAARRLTTGLHFARLVVMFVAFVSDSSTLAWLLSALYASEAGAAYVAGRRRGTHFTGKELAGREQPPSESEP